MTKPVKNNYISIKSIDLEIRKSLSNAHVYHIFRNAIKYRTEKKVNQMYTILRQDETTNLMMIMISKK